MINKNIIYGMIIAGCLISGFISGWQIKGCVTVEKKYMSPDKPVVQIHDTIKTKVIQYKYIPGADYNVDSLMEVINGFWRDSLKNLYGKGMFEASFTKEDKTGKREITLASRIPIDPEATVAVDEQLVLPAVYLKSRFGIYGGMGIEREGVLTGLLGGKYYIMDFRNFSAAGIVEGRYSLSEKSWRPGARIEMEVRF